MSGTVSISREALADLWEIYGVSEGPTVRRSTVQSVEAALAPPPQ